MNSGLYAFAGDSATATAAAWANRLDEPMTNVSNVYFGLSRLPPSRRSPAEPAVGAGRCLAGPRVPTARGCGAAPRSHRAGTAGRAGVGGSVDGGRACAARRSRAGATVGAPRRRDRRTARPAPCRRPAAAPGVLGGGRRRSTGAAVGDRRRTGRRRSAGAVGRGRGVAGGRAVLGGRTVTATWIGRPSRRESASVIAGRSCDSMTSRVNASGHGQQRGVLDDRAQPGQPQVGPLLRETISSASSSVAAVHTAARSTVSVTVAPPPSPRAPGRRCRPGCRPRPADAPSTGRSVTHPVRPTGTLVHRLSTACVSTGSWPPGRTRRRPAPSRRGA